MKALRSRGLSQREACSIAKARRRSSREKPSTKAHRDAVWAARLTEFAQLHPEDGCKPLYEGSLRECAYPDEYMNYKRFRRLYRLANLQFGQRRRRGRAKIIRGRSLRRATKPFEGWTLDFMHDRLFSTRAFRMLGVEDEFTRRGLALRVSFTFPSRSVVETLDELARDHGYPIISARRQRRRTDVEADAAVVGKARHRVALHSAWEADAKCVHRIFNSRVRMQLLNTRWFRTIAEVQAASDVWHDRYNTMHAHSNLNYLTPEEFTHLYEINRPPQKSLAA